MHLGKVTILHISLRSIAEYFAKNSLRSFGKKICKQFASLIWQKKSLYRANFATFASLNICKIILNVRSAHYLQINLFTLATLAYKLGPSLVFFGLPNFVLFRLLQQVGCRYTYFDYVEKTRQVAGTGKISPYNSNGAHRQVINNVQNLVNVVKARYNFAQSVPTHPSL